VKFSLYSQCNIGQIILFIFLVSVPESFLECEWSIRKTLISSLLETFLFEKLLLCATYNSTFRKIFSCSINPDQRGSGSRSEGRVKIHQHDQWPGRLFFRHKIIHLLNSEILFLYENWSIFWLQKKFLCKNIQSNFYPDIVFRIYFLSWSSLFLQCISKLSWHFCLTTYIHLHEANFSNETIFLKKKRF